MKRALTLLGLLLAAPVLSAGDTDLETVVGWMSGSFSSADQAAEDLDFYHITLEMAPIWTDRAGETRGTGSKSALRGASYAASEVVVTPEGIESWDRGFDADGRQVWGAEEGAYVFKRRK